MTVRVANKRLYFGAFISFCKPTNKFYLRKNIDLYQIADIMSSFGGDLTNFSTPEPEPPSVEEFNVAFEAYMDRLLESRDQGTTPVVDGSWTGPQYNIPGHGIPCLFGSENVTPAPCAFGLVCR